MRRGTRKKAVSLYVEDSKINVGTEENSTASLTLYHYDSNETSNVAQWGGTITLNVGSEVNLYGTLNADIVSRTRRKLSIY